MDKDAGGAGMCRARQANHSLFSRRNQSVCVETKPHKKYQGKYIVLNSLHALWYYSMQDYRTDFGTLQSIFLGSIWYSCTQNFLAERRSNLHSLQLNEHDFGVLSIR